MDDPKDIPQLPGAAGERFHRRGFFAEGLRNLIRPFADIVEKRLDTINSSFWDDDGEPSGASSLLESASSSAPAPPDTRFYLRPPGALPEGEFLQRCTSSGRCVSACPVSAIRLISSGDARTNWKPAIEPKVQACVLCEDMSCMKACPGGALRPIPREEIRMGLAVLDPERCFRSGGEDCRICVDKCPAGAAAIDVSRPGGQILVKADGCKGCGMCEMYCPADPVAIRVERREGQAR